MRFPRRENIAKLEEISPRHMKENEDGWELKGASRLEDIRIDLIIRIE